MSVSSPFGAPCAVSLQNLFLACHMAVPFPATLTACARCAPAAVRSVASGGLDGNSIGNPFMPLADGEDPYGQIPAATTPA